MDPRDHWEGIYRAKGPAQVSWYEPEPRTCLEFIGTVALKPEAAIVDVGGGASLLVDRLLDRGFTNVTVVDLSARALASARERLGARARSVRWLQADARDLKLPQPVDLWHDRAVFHFLISPDDQAGYLRSLRAAVRPGGHAVMATFGLEGPRKCSGLDVARYSAATLSEKLGKEFELLKSAEHTHLTPGGAPQRFTYCLFRRLER